MVKDLCFEIINKCPNNCIFCSSNSCIEKDTTISFTDFKNVIDHFTSQGGILELSISGGEPFLHPDLYKMIEYAKSFGIRTTIFTSGVKNSVSLSEDEKQYLENEMNNHLKRVDKEEPWNERLKTNIKNMYSKIINKNVFEPISKDELAKLKELDLDKIVFDFQAYDQDKDKLIMGRDSNNYFCLLTSLINATFVGLETDVHFIPMKPNYKDISDILELLEIAGINNISILNFIPQGRGYKNKDTLMLTDDELNEFMNILETNRHKFSGNIRTSIPLQGEITHKCNAGLEKLDIKYDGTILPCPAFKELSIETMKKYGIKYYNIYENLNEVKTPGGKRTYPLCKKIYNFKTEV